MTPLVDEATLGKVVAWIQLIGGTALLVSGFRQRGQFGERLAPIGAVAILAAAAIFLGGTMPDGVFIAVWSAAFIALVVWWVRLNRAWRARIGEVRKQRDAGVTPTD